MGDVFLYRNFIFEGWGILADQILPLHILCTYGSIKLLIIDPQIFMSRSNRTGKPKVLYFTEPLIDMVQRFMDERGVVSFSEVVRRSIEFYYFEHFKAAYEPTAKDHEKKKQLAEEARLRAMSDKDFGVSICRGIVAKGKEGRLFVILHTAFNSLFAVPADDIKKWPKLHPEELQSHLTALKSKTTQEQFRYAAIRSFLSERWGIQFDENEQLIS